MRSLWSIYHGEIPDFVMQLANTPAMLRLKDIGMHCGCEYTQFPQYAQTPPYSRWVHSVGVALIVWHFTQDAAQTTAALLHDIASPIFAHVVDFLNGDHLGQESTEDGTASIISLSAEITSLLDALGLTQAQVADYHQYPVADNDSPHLSADRLEYTLGNTLCHGRAGLNEIRAVYADLIVADDGEGRPEIQFRSEACAQQFCRWSLANSRVYVCDEDRFSMQALADLLRDGLDRGVIAREDLHTTEQEVIQKLRSDATLATRWEQFTRYARIIRSAERPESGYWVKLDSKRRCIDPLVASRGRMTALCPEYQTALQSFRTEKYNYWMSAAENG